MNVITFLNGLRLGTLLGNDLFQKYDFSPYMST